MMTTMRKTSTARGWIRRPAMLALFVALASCGEDTVTAPPDPNTIGPEGGTLSFAAGAVTLVVPPNAVSTDLTFTVTPTVNFPASPRVVAGTIYDFGPAGIQFAVLVELMISYPTANLPAGIRASEVRLYRAAASVWQPIAGSRVDVAAETAIGSISGFSVIGVLGVPVASISVSPQAANLQLGGSVKLVATPRDAEGTELPERSVNWSTSDPAIAAVDEAGLVTGLAVGSATITAASEARTDSASVTVVPQANPSLQLVVGGLSRPVGLTATSGASDRLFVVEQTGTIRIIQGGELLATPFLDVGDQIISGGERGLLGLAFHPDYAQNGTFFVNYTDLNGDTRVVRYRVSTDPNLADPASAEIVLTIDQPYANHNGGQLAFGPDGRLYIGMGDGGSGGDPDGNGQDLGTLLGALLRIDVDGGSPYAIPSDNPFVDDAAARHEIWAYGLRNPWRFSFDRETGDLYIGDVGQVSWEEIDVQSTASGGGANYGWNIMEGAHCYNAASCDQTGLVLPTLEYSHADGCSVTGGYVYRGSAVPILTGHYLYADYCSGWVRSFRYEGGQAVDARDWSSDLSPGGQLSSFGEDADGELYIMTLAGNLYRIVPGS